MTTWWDRYQRGLALRRIARRAVEGSTLWLDNLGVVVSMADLDTMPPPYTWATQLLRQLEMDWEFLTRVLNHDTPTE